MTAARRRWFLALRLALAAAVVLGFTLVLRRLDGRAFLAAIARVGALPLLAAGLLNFVYMAVKALRWKVMLRRVRRVSLWRMFRYTVATYAMSTILPLRFGELVRLWLLKSREEIAATTTSAVAV